MARGLAKTRARRKLALPSRRLRREDKNQMVLSSPSLPLPVHFSAERLAAARQREVARNPLGQRRLDEGAAAVHRLDRGDQSLERTSTGSVASRSWEPAVPPAW
jgi:hypothetical protein